jgi:uncharacterized protein (TIGR02266 family)
VAVATQAIQNGFDALYVRAADLQTALDRAAEQGQWREVLGQYTRPDVLLVDDIDGVITEKNGLFLVLNERCLARRTVILTARTLPEYWASSGRGGLHTTTAVERLMARGQTLLLDPADSSHDRVTLDLSRRPLLLKDTVPTNTEPAEPAETSLPATPTPALAEGPERRIHRRHSVDLEVNVTSQHNFFTGFCRDISEGGLFLATYDLRPTGDLIDLHFTLPGGHEIRTTGIVRWQRTWSGEGQEWPGIGVEFLALSPEDKAAILAFFGTREPLFYA